jgi:type IV pilus assembly protein PilC
MPSFLYTARDEAGQVVTGQVNAGSIADVTRQLRAEQKYPVQIKPAAASSGQQGNIGLDTGVLTSGLTEGAAARRDVKIKRHELINLSTQLSVMLETGVTLTEALDCIARQSRQPKYKALVTDLSHSIQGGSDFSAAISRHPRSFPRLYVALMRAAEKSGMMSKMLLRATAYLRDEQETMRRVKGALTYPLIMLSFAVLTTGFLLAFVLPRFAAIYANKGAALPGPTRFLLGCSNLLVNHYFAVAGVVLTVAAGGYFFFRSEGGRQFWHSTQLRLPLLGEMFRKLHMSRGLRMMSTLCGSGVNLVDCVENTIDACTSLPYRRLWQSVSVQIQQGKPMSEPIGQSNLIPGDVAQMLHSGENSGKLAVVMEQIATYTESELKDKIAELTRYIEPAMIIIMGAIIGGVALALMLPVFTISRVVAG